jgi:hypothetical protein
MKKELLIVILVVIGIIGVSILLKYVIFASHSRGSNTEPKSICEAFCKKENFSTGRCGCDCSDDERKFPPERFPKQELDDVQKSCGAGTKTEPGVACTWTCCCK